MKQLKTIVAFFCLFTIIISVFRSAHAQNADDLNSYNESPSRLRGVIEKFREDYGSLNRFYTAQTSPNRAARFKQFYADWLAILEK